MSRMIFGLCLMTILPGCMSTDAPYRVALVTNRLGTIGLNGISFGGYGRGCDACLPHKPYTSGYDAYWDHYITEHTAQRCAFRGLKEYKSQFGDQVSPHFKLGFIAAYEDLALNRRPSPPIAPPPKYWNAYYRSSAGQPCVEDWFAGYDAGLEMGNNNGISDFREVYLRRTSVGYGNSNRVDFAQAATRGNSASRQPAQQQPLTPTPMPMTPVPTYGGYTQ